MRELKYDRRKKSDQNKQLRRINRLNKENEVLEKKYLLVSLKLNYLKNSMKNLNHDLRSPLNGITGMIDVLLNDDKDQMVVEASDLILIRESAQAILDLINSSLMYKGIQKSLTTHMNIDKILSAVMVEIERLYLPMAKNKGITLSLRTEIDSELKLPPNFFINLIQITGNLVANAIKFTPANGSVEVLCTLGTEDNHEVLNMAVTDTGKGMTRDQVSDFNQGKPVARSMGTNGEDGFGIGLQHVIKMVFEDYGRIMVNSEKGLGTTFSLTFPLSDQNLSQKSPTHLFAENGKVSQNGHQS